MNPIPISRHFGLTQLWRFCLIIAVIVNIPRLNLMVWNFDGTKEQLVYYTLSLSTQIIGSFLFGMAFALLHTESPFRIILWYQRRAKLVRWGIQILLIIAITEAFYQVQLFLTNATATLDYNHSTFYLRHLVVYVALQGFWYFLRVIESSNQVQMENEQLKRIKIKNQLEALSNQLNPHFLFNALNILNISIATNPEEAQKLVHHLSDILRFNLKVQNQNLVRLSEELEVAHSYLGLNKARFGNKLLYSFNTPPTKTVWYVVPLSLQILLENAIKHNVITSNSILQIEICVNESEKLLEIRNSINRKTQVDSLGIGLANLGKRNRLITGKATSLSEDEKHFIVTVPLVEAP